MNNEVIVSICCTAYNHEKYITETLEGFLKQVTNFKYEIIVHDDASTDNTAKIIKLYEQKYPDIIKAIYQTDNKYSKNEKIIKKYIAPYTHGKYIALCEGDDFWFDKYKLQKQVDAMEKHSDCFLCLHKVEEVKENGSKTGVLFPSNIISTGIIKTEDFLKIICRYSFQTSSYFFNGNKWREYQEEEPEFKKICPVGDETYLLYFAYIGSIYYIDDIMSCYRRGVPSSWSQLQNTGNIIDKKCKYVMAMARTMQLFDKYTSYKYHGYCLMREAYYLKTSWLLQGEVRSNILKQRELFDTFSLKHKILLIIASLFPEIAQKIYKNKFINKSKQI